MDNAQEYIKGYFVRARKAQAEYETYTQDQVDQIVKTIAKTVFDHAAPLAVLAVEETGMGVYEDKVLKNQNKAKIIWNSLKGKKSVGIISRNEVTGITEIAKPMGVVAAITPMTNPIVTPMSNAMFALKGRNAIIITAHHKAIRSSSKTIELINDALKKIHAPENLIQIIGHQSRENTKALIETADIVIATGGMGMVKAAYSSGKPALGVGAGNVQCIIDTDADIQKAVPQIVIGRAFDNGILCSAEQSVIAPASRYEEIISAFKDQDTYVITNKEERDKLREALFEHGVMNKAVIGQSIHQIAALAGLDIPDKTKAILVEAENTKDILGKEKMCAVLALYKYNSFEEAVEIAKSNLDMEGKGHSVSIHSDTIEHIEYAAQVLSVSRFVINQCCATSAGGSFFNGLAPTNTLGCGSWGGNSISENLDYKHLINISRIGYFMKNNPVPSEEELWA
jgi:succinate-semialdehyde dehydrogenase